MNHGFTCRRIVAAIGVTFAFGSAPFHAAHADTWPAKPVTMVAFAPGGMTDIVGRLLAAELTESLKQGFVVENRPGAAGQLATEHVARKPNDGYTLLLSVTGQVIGPAVQKSVRYRPVKEFEPIALIAKAPNMLVVNPSVSGRPAGFSERPPRAPWEAPPCASAAPWVWRWQSRPG